MMMLHLSTAALHIIKSSQGVPAAPLVSQSVASESPGWGGISLPTGMISRGMKDLLIASFTDWWAIA